MSFIMSRSSGLKQNHHAYITTTTVVEKQEAKPTLQSISVSDLLKLSPEEIRNSLNSQQAQKQEKTQTTQQSSVMVGSGSNIMNRPHGIKTSVPIVDLY